MMDTQFITRNAKRYQPLLLRGFLWVSIAMLTDLRHSASDLQANKEGISALQWADALVGSLLAGAIALRVFLDTSVARFHEDQTKP